MYGYASGKWDNIFQNFQKRRKPNLWGISYRESSPHLIFLLEFQELSVGWFVIGEFNDSRILSMFVVFAVVLNCRFAIAALCFVGKSSSFVIVVR